MGPAFDALAWVTGEAQAHARQARTRDWTAAALLVNEATRTVHAAGERLAALVETEGQQ